MADLKEIISRIDEAVLLRRRRAKETLRSVYRVDSCIVKEFDIPAKCHHYRKPWLTEASARKRIVDKYPGAALGVVERIDGDMRKVFFVKRYMEGKPLQFFRGDDIHGIAKLLAEFHAKGVITDDAHADNFLRTPSGKINCIDFGRAKVFCVTPAPACAVGRELAKLYREGFSCDNDAFQTFLEDYYVQTNASWARRQAIVLCGWVTFFLHSHRRGREK